MRVHELYGTSETRLRDYAVADHADGSNGQAFSTDELLGIFASALEKRPDTARAARLLALSEYAALARRLAGWARTHAEQTTAEALIERAHQAEGRAAALREPLGLAL